MRHLKTSEISQICADLPVEVWNRILIKTNPSTCFVFWPIFANTEGFDTHNILIWLYKAAGRGYLGIVQDLYRKIDIECPDVLANQWFTPMDCAAINGHLEVIKWLDNNRAEGCTGMAWRQACSGGHLEVIKWLHENQKEGCPKAVADYALMGGHFEIVKFLQENRKEGCSEATMDFAVRNKRKRDALRGASQTQSHQS